jgi:hypothetical protein
MPWRLFFVAFALQSTFSSLESTRVPLMSKMKARSTEVEAYRKSDATWYAL